MARPERFELPTTWFEFVYLYRTLVGGVPEAEARAVMDQVWDPGEFEQWAGLIERVKAARGGATQRNSE